MWRFLWLQNFKSEFAQSNYRSPKAGSAYIKINRYRLYFLHIKETYKLFEQK